MAARGDFNIFSSSYIEPDKLKAANFFSLITNLNQQHDQQFRAKQSAFKRQNFHKEIRLQQNDEKRKRIREDLVQSLKSKSFYLMIESLVARNHIESKNISNLISDLVRNLSDFQFCTQLNQNKKIKQFILELYLIHMPDLSLEQKGLLVRCLTYMTYYGLDVFDQEQKQKLCDLMINQIRTIETFDCGQMDYLISNVDLLTNVVSDNDKDVNMYLMDTSIFSDVCEKISHFYEKAQKVVEIEKDGKLYNKYVEGLSKLRGSFLSVIYNLALKQIYHQQFFKLAINQITCDLNYLKEYGCMVLKIFNLFFREEKYRLKFVETAGLTSWFQNQVPRLCQEKFNNLESIKTKSFEEIMLTSEERQLFYQFLRCISVWTQREQEQQVLDLFDLLIKKELNGFCLSEFLIQSATNNRENRTRNSIHVAEAIKMYEHLASDPDITLEKLLLVTQHRTFEDIFKVFIDQTYFSSCKIAESTLKVLNIMLSKDSHLLKTFIELRIFDSIEHFLSQPSDIQKSQQIISFIDLLFHMIAADDDLAKQERKNQNKLAQYFSQNQLVKRIQKYQEHQNKQVSDKTITFLQYFSVILNQNN